MSLTNTGLARVHSHSDSEGERLVKVLSIKTPPATGLAATRERLEKIVSVVKFFVDESTDPRVVIEGLALSAQHGKQWDRAGLWWMVVAALKNYPITEIPPTSRAKFATGNGRSPKDEVMIAAVKRYPMAGISDNNTADAVLLAAMGARYGGYPLEDSLPYDNRSALDKVHWAW